MTALSVGQDVFLLQAQALQQSAERLNQHFSEAVAMILANQGRLIVSGMGKSGIIGSKIAATLASTGTPSFFVHPAEAYHGDLGMFTGQDIALLISYSGETEEVVRLIASLRHVGTRIVAMVGNPQSTLARHADLVLDVQVEREACPHNLAPTTSTTVSLAMGDALAMALMRERRFQPQDFAVFHPGGSLGRRLLTRVKDMMHGKVPVVKPADSLRDVIVAMTTGGLGLCVVLAGQQILGVITDGDLRRALYRHQQFEGLQAADIMTVEPRCIAQNQMFCDAEQLMLAANITALLVTDEAGMLQGVLKLQDARGI